MQRIRVLARVIVATVTDAAEVLVGTLRLAVRHPRASQLRSERLRIAIALRRSKARYQSLFLHAPFGIYVVTRAGRLVSANWALARILGYSSVAAVLAVSARAFYARPEDADTPRAGAQDTWPQCTDLPWRRCDGQTIIVRLTGRALGDAGSDEETFEVFVQDVTEERRLEAAVRQANKLEAVGRLAAGIAHDFNNLLTSILGYTELALEQTDSARPVHADLVEIHKAGQSAANLTRQLLTLTHKQSVRLEVVDLNAVIRASEPMIRRTLGEAMVVVVRLAPALYGVKADALDVEQGLLNLCLNARDAMATGGTLTIETANVSADDIRPLPWPETGKPGRYVRLTVTDTGGGMDATTKGQIFEPFFTTKGQNHGTGLGLAMVHGMVTQLHGHVCVDSEPGVGSTFSLYLPATDEIAVEPRPVLVHVVPRSAGETVLVVEDEQAVRTLVVSVLTRHGYQVLEATTPRDALALMAGRTTPIDLVLSDVVLPEMQGPALVAQLRGQAHAFRVVYMSGYAAHALREGLAAGTEAFLAKPFRHAELLQAVRGVLDAA